MRYVIAAALIIVANVTLSGHAQSLAPKLGHGEINRSRSETIRLANRTSATRRLPPIDQSEQRLRRLPPLEAEHDAGSTATPHPDIDREISLYREFREQRPEETEAAKLARRIAELTGTTSNFSVRIPKFASLLGDHLRDQNERVPLRLPSTEETSDQPRAEEMPSTFSIDDVDLSDFAATFTEFLEDAKHPASTMVAAGTESLAATNSAGGAGELASIGADSDSKVVSSEVKPSSTILRLPGIEIEESDDAEAIHVADASSLPRHVAKRLVVRLPPTATTKR